MRKHMTFYLSMTWAASNMSFLGTHPTFTQLPHGHTLEMVLYIVTLLKWFVDDTRENEMFRGSSKNKQSNKRRAPCRRSPPAHGRRRAEGRALRCLAAIASCGMSSAAAWCRSTCRSTMRS